MLEAAQQAEAHLHEYDKEQVGKRVAAHRFIANRLIVIALLPCFITSRRIVSRLIARAGVGDELAGRPPKDPRFCSVQKFALPSRRETDIICLPTQGRSQDARLRTSVSARSKGPLSSFDWALA